MLPVLEPSCRHSRATKSSHMIHRGRVRGGGAMASTMTQSLQELDLAHVVHPNIGIQELNERGPVTFVEGHGVHLKDSNGKEYLDARSGLTNCNLGYGNEEVARAAYDQMNGLH